MAKKRVKKRRIKYSKLFLVLIIVFLALYLLLNCINLNISNIFVLNNDILSDQTIIELAGISDYPSSLITFSKKIEKNLEENLYVKNAKIYKKWITQVYIEIDENKPLFYNKSENIVVLEDGSVTSDNFVVPTLINYVPDSIYSDFIKKMNTLDYDVSNRISEIKYDPNNVDDERFLFTMTDGNLVYMTINKFESINNYIDIIKEFNNERGILYLDSGEYFEKFNR